MMWSLLLAIATSPTIASAWQCSSMNSGSLRQIKSSYPSGEYETELEVVVKVNISTNVTLETLYNSTWALCENLWADLNVTEEDDDSCWVYFVIEDVHWPEVQDGEMVVVILDIVTHFHWSPSEKHNKVAMKLHKLIADHQLAGIISRKMIQGLEMGIYAYGDPHLKNMAGEKFDVTATGVHTALHIPRGAEDSDVQLLLKINTKSLGGECDSTFATEIMVAGNLLGPAKQVLFKAGKAFSATIGHETALHKSDAVWTLAQSQVPPAGWPSSGTFDTSLKAATGFNGRPNFKISMGTVSIKVENAVYKDYNILNLDVRGVGAIKLPIGGILGFDSHQRVSAVPPQCAHAKAKAKIYQSNSPALDYSLQVA